MISNLIDGEMSFTNTMEWNMKDAGFKCNGNHARWRDAEGTKREDNKLDKQQLR